MQVSNINNIAVPSDVGCRLDVFAHVYTVGMTGIIKECVPCAGQSTIGWACQWGCGFLGVQTLRVGDC